MAEVFPAESVEKDFEGCTPEEIGKKLAQETNAYSVWSAIEDCYERKVYVRVGEYDAALDQIDHLLSVSSGLSVALLRLDPRWDPLRDHPRYQELLKRYAAEPEEAEEEIPP